MSIQHFLAFREHEQWAEPAHFTALTYAWTTPSSGYALATILNSTAFAMGRSCLPLTGCISTKP